MNAVARLGAIVLAAGASSRMGGEDKLLKHWRGRALVSWAIDAACASCAGRVIVVAGANIEDIEHQGATRAVFVRNPNPADGLSASLALGVETLGDVDAAAIVLGDMPAISADLIDRLFDARRDGDYAVLPTHEGVWGHPVVLSRAALRDALSLRGDRGARTLLEARRANVREVAVETSVILLDLDRQADFES